MQSLVVMSMGLGPDSMAWNPSPQLKTHSILDNLSEPQFLICIEGVVNLLCLFHKDFLSHKRDSALENALLTTELVCG